MKNHMVFHWIFFDFFHVWRISKKIQLLFSIAIFFRSWEKFWGIASMQKIMIFRFMGFPARSEHSKPSKSRHGPKVRFFLIYLQSEGPQFQKSSVHQRFKENEIRTPKVLRRAEGLWCTRRTASDMIQSNYRCTWLQWWVIDLKASMRHAEHRNVAYSIGHKSL